MLRVDLLARRVDELEALARRHRPAEDAGADREELALVGADRERRAVVGAAVVDEVDLAVAEHAVGRAVAVAQSAAAAQFGVGLRRLPDGW
jgi:hypothetical protein